MSMRAAHSRRKHASILLALEKDDRCAAIRPKSSIKTHRQKKMLQRHLIKPLF